MNSELDIGKLALSIMEHPELIEKIKALGDSGEKGEHKEPAHEEKSELHRGNSKRRSALLCSLKPYLSDKRRSAIDTMITVFDVLDTVISK